MAPGIVVGALGKYLRQQPERGMQSLIEEFTVDGRISVPTRIYANRALRNNGAISLSRKINDQNFLIRRLLAEPPPKIIATHEAFALQTGVDEVQLAA
jgi:hypothetical protein